MNYLESESTRSTVHKGVVDLFAGVGGLSLGFQQAGFDILAANEHDDEIAESYIINHPETDVFTGDIESMNYARDLGKYKEHTRVVIGGPPCQGFSQKGSRQSILDKRNFLFRDFVSAVEFLNPEYFVMENVPNLLTANDGFFRGELETAFEQIGYKITAKVLSANDYQVPQRRRRAVIIGKYREIPPAHPLPSLNNVTVWDAISDLAYHGSGEGSDNEPYKTPPKTRYQTALRAGSSVLHNHKATKHSKLALDRMGLMPPNSGVKSLPEEHRTKSIYSGTWTRLVKEEYAPTITTRFDTPSSGQFTHPLLNRAITVREAARLQSFPDTYRFIGTKGSQMRQVGNAVPPRLARAIAETILRDINEVT